MSPRRHTEGQAASESVDHQHVTADGLASLQSEIDAKGNRLFCVLLANSQARLGTYVALAQAIHEAGHRAVVAHFPNVLPSSAEELVGFESVVFLSTKPERLKLLKGVDLFFSPEVMTGVTPPGAAAICIPHSLPDTGLTQNVFKLNPPGIIRQNPTVIQTFDYFVASVRQEPAEWSEANYAVIQDVYPAPMLKDRRKFLDIVPGGYPKIEYSRRILASSSTPDALIYTPTRGQGAVASRVRRDGAAILSALLRGFPGLTIVFRPYPLAADIEFGRELAESFMADPRFRFDDTATGIQYQRRSAVAITDSSSSAVTFALATGRPLVSVDLKPHEEARGVRVTEHPLGFGAESSTAMIEAVRRGIDESARWRRAIGDFAGAALYNPASAATYLAAHLERFAARDSDPAWLSVERGPWTGTGEPGEVDRHLDRLRSWAEDARGPFASRLYEEVERHLRPSS